MKKLDETETVEARVKIVGRRDHVEKMVRFLDMIDMCRQGSTRTFTVWYDGDGSARLKVTDLEGNTLVKRTPKSWDVLNAEPLKINFE